MTSSHDFRYNKLCGGIRRLANRIALLEPQDPFRAKMTERLLEKLYAMGVITAKSALSACEKVTVSAFCR